MGLRTGQLISYYNIRKTIGVQYLMIHGGAWELLSWYRDAEHFVQDKTETRRFLQECVTKNLTFNIWPTSETVSRPWPSFNLISRRWRFCVKQDRNEMLTYLEMVSRPKHIDKTKMSRLQIPGMLYDTIWHMTHDWTAPPNPKPTRPRRDTIHAKLGLCDVSMP